MLTILVLWYLYYSPETSAVMKLIKKKIFLILNLYLHKGVGGEESLCDSVSLCTSVGSRDNAFWSTQPFVTD